MGLGNFDRAYESLTTAAQDMDEAMIYRGWYWRLIVWWGLTNLWLAKGDLSHARLQAESFLNAALTTAERMWQALAWDANARVAMADGNLTKAQTHVVRALAIVDGFEVPMAHWRVHATASQFYFRSGARNLACTHC